MISILCVCIYIYILHYIYMGAQHYRVDSSSCLHQSWACEWTASESESSGSLKIQHVCTAAGHGPGCSEYWELPASPNPAQEKRCICGGPPRKLCLTCQIECQINCQMWHVAPLSSPKPKSFSSRDLVWIAYLDPRSESTILCNFMLGTQQPTLAKYSMMKATLCST